MLLYIVIIITCTDKVEQSFIIIILYMHNITVANSCLLLHWKVSYRYCLLIVMHLLFSIYLLAVPKAIKPYISSMFLRPVIYYNSNYYIAA